MYPEDYDIYIAEIEAEMHICTNADERILLNDRLMIAKARRNGAVMSDHLNQALMEVIL